MCIRDRGNTMYKNTSERLEPVMKNFFELSALNIDNELVHFSKFKSNKAILVVNVASKCGYTAGNYTELGKFYDQHHKRGLEILAFPCNQFMKQEGNSEKEIKEFVCSTYQVKFPLFAKVDVNGHNTHEVYRYLRTKSPLYDERTGLSKQIPWNFSKFLVDSQGNVCKVYPPCLLYTSPSPRDS
eukprot:TRINITY_DN5728_c0_g1_i8.p1 TRINITY_DN5728_c0_g1~~TRINITY_DN5728_c0_g1_i8.p1  ORF type:complete len:184 (-),score=16.86 TRINITY_DN5728_c0_g1_i8:26-577(-)